MYLKVGQPKIIGIRNWVKKGKIVTCSRKIRVEQLDQNFEKIFLQLEISKNV